MVNEGNFFTGANGRLRLGSILIWVGVFVWVPFIALRIMGEKPSLFWYLPFHLIGVVGGAQLRAAARKQLGLVMPKKNLLQMLGHIAIFAGILVWAPYFYFKASDQPVEVMNFLPYHLTGVLAGVGLLLVNYFRNQAAEKDS